MADTPYPRDLRGYGRNPPSPQWPGGARVAVQCVINYEEGSEYNNADSDGRTELGLAEAPGGRVPPGRRDMAFESMYEYGSRVGFWRLMRLFQERGLPATVFRLDATYEAAVFEMGMSALGEIERLSRTAAPSLAVITNIGVSHIETLGSKENILKAKLEVTAGMSPDSALIVNLDDELLAGAPCPGMNKIGFAVKNPLAAYRAAEVKKTQTGICFTALHPLGETPVNLPVHGLHNVYNALAAFAAGCEAGVEPARAAEALGRFSPTGMRQKIKTAGSITYIEDCYNAGPDSQRAALLTLAGIQAKRRIAVLGDMLELGAIAVSEHEALGRFAAAQGVDILLTFGPLSEHTAAAARKAGMKQVLSFDSKQRLAETLAGLLEPGDAVLFKASRGMKLEEAIELVYKEMKVDE